MKKTIAIVGATESPGKIIAEKFASMPYRLLLISNKTNELDILKNSLSVINPETEIEALDCVKDGCWEADIIILAVPSNNMKHIVERIREVATQKIVVEVIIEKENREELSKSLPYSKLVNVSGDFQAQLFICGEDKAVNEEIKEIFILAGFKIESKKLQATKSIQLKKQNKPGLLKNTNN